MQKNKVFSNHENPPEVSYFALKGGVWSDTSFNRQIFRMHGNKVSSTENAKHFLVHKKKYLTLLILTFIFLLVANNAFAAEPDRILSNSEDWRDVYSVMQYGILSGKTANFLVSNRHATLILNQIPRESHVWAVTSEDLPV